MLVVHAWLTSVWKRLTVLPSLRIPAVSAVSLLLPMKLVICKFFELYYQWLVVKTIHFNNLCTFLLLFKLIIYFNVEINKPLATGSRDVDSSIAITKINYRLGAVHDGSPPPSYLGGPGAEKCRWEDGFIMSDLRHTERGFRWSPCTIQSFHHFLKYVYYIFVLLRQYSR